MNCDNCGLSLETGEESLCEDCGGLFCEVCIDPEVHQCPALITESPIWEEAE